MEGVAIEKIVKKLELKKLTEGMDLTGHRIVLSDVNRPALQLSGYFEHFEEKRVQIIGNVEYTYLQQLEHDKKIDIYNQFLKYEIPCVIFCRDLEPDEEFLRIAQENGVPVFGTGRSTSEFMAELIHTLSEELAPCITIHGVLVDVYGEGVLITGESGIGIIDVKTLYGVECVKEKQNIDLVIKLEDWKKDNDYDRLGLEEEYIEYLGNKVACHSLPIRPGRNLAVICETAAVNHRQKKMGYNAAQELYRRVQANINKDNDSEE